MDLVFAAKKTALTKVVDEDCKVATLFVLALDNEDMLDLKAAFFPEMDINMAVVFAALLQT